MDENDLLKRLKEGDELAFEEVYNTYNKKLLAFARSLNISVNDSEEIVQETFIRVWNNRTTIQLGLSFNAWLITIARNLIYNHVKKEAVRTRYAIQVVEEKMDHIPVDYNELKRIIDDAVITLPDKCKEVFCLSRFEGFSNQEIADQLTISKSTVENHMNKALKLIKLYLVKQGYPYGIPMWILIILF